MTPNTASVTERAVSQASLIGQAIVQKARKLIESMSSEFGRRLQNAQAAFDSEMSWQLARREPVKRVGSEQELIAGLLVSPLGRPIPLKEGLNALKGSVLRIENGDAVLIDAQTNASRRLCTNERLILGAEPQILKLFIRDRMARSTQIREETP